MMDETTKQLFTFLGTAGGVAFLTMIANAVKKLYNGAASRERVKTTSLVRRTEVAEAKKDEAEAEAEVERKLRIKAEYHVALLEQQVVRLGGIPVLNPKDTE
ncbi:hypothetical protein GORDON_32 [Arthrobacter phage Gordon]|uniref:Uncharacterized protein n=3 Tax=Gordonvirus TaxID=1982152 RepID=A0A345KL76_9CAUD|nr:hypothetical protein FDH69_gp32 [Arthrobacter phage Gordon]YP_010750048.1 hypothetical protein QCN34_gp33 [Arthrobacter phage Breylor17]ALY09007.1 hypothetical protein GORDON_32 [Arthrobacter phage Gordon]AXH43778.1 hypothetical protein SEA_BREYLOR17_33 [Arthrobacter phage Breylor17]